MERKYELLFFNTFDYTGISRHLEKMAAEGWLIDKPGNLLWRYRAVEPQKLNFHVAYFPMASNFDPGPRPEQREFQDFCRRTGWTAAASYGQAQFYYNSSAEPEPLETEPYAQIRNIQKAARKFDLPLGFLMLTLGLLNTGIFVSEVCRWPLDALSSNASLILAAVCLLAMTFALVYVGGYLVWLRRAKKAAALGEFTDSRPFAVRNWLSMIFLLMLILLVLWAERWLASSSEDWHGRIAHYILYFLCLLLPLTVLSPVLRRKNIPASVNRTITMCVAFLLTMILWVVESSYLGKVDSGAAQETEFVPPLTAEDLCLEDSGTFSYVRGSVSPLLGRYAVGLYQSVSNGEASYSNRCLIDYIITEVKLPPLYSFCRSYLFDEPDESDEEDIPGGTRWIYEPQDASFWRAGEAYRLVRQDVGSADIWLLCYDGYIVELTFYEPPTDAQLTAAAEKFGELILFCDKKA